MSTKIHCQQPVPIMGRLPRSSMRRAILGATLFVVSALHAQTGKVAAVASASSGAAGDSYIVPYGERPLQAAKNGYVSIFLPFHPKKVANNGAVFGSPLRWYQGELQTLSAPAGWDGGSEPIHMNKQGEVVGYGGRLNGLDVGSTDTYAVYWPLNQPLGVPLAYTGPPLGSPSGRERPDRFASSAHFITESGMILGELFLGENEEMRFIDGIRWLAPHAEPQRLGTSPLDSGFVRTYPREANSSGILIGQHLDSFSYFIGAVDIDSMDFQPEHINDQGRVIGRDAEDYHGIDGVYWNGVRHDLPGFYATSLNHVGDLLGDTLYGPALLPYARVQETIAGLPVDYLPLLVRNWVPDNWDLNNESGVTDISDNGMIVGTAIVRDADGGETQQGFLLVPAALAVDANRDGHITLSEVDDSDLVTVDEPYRIWINDDDDAGDTQTGADVPNGLSPKANFKDAFVNGTRDLVDYFPVFLDLKRLLEVLPPGGSTQYMLRHEAGALNFVYTNLQRERAHAWQRELLTTGFGDDFGQRPGEAATHHITAHGVALAPDFLTGVRDAGWGVILIEGRAASAAPLILAVVKDGVTITEVRLELRINRVEDMFRHLDLRLQARNYDGTPVVIRVPGLPTRMSDPGDAFPDTATNGKYFVFVHGYNVDAQTARGWQAEVFKRMFALGSRARFVGVSWHGATGLDYHQAVFHAFQTGDALAAALNLPAGTDITIAAHSLGNMLVSHAIQDGGFAPSRYYMINAAVPLEAYDFAGVLAEQRAAMTEQGWKDSDPRLYSANWHELFRDDPGDFRQRLTWKDRFQSVLPRVYNFFSPGEDVVENSTFDSASVVTKILRQGFNFSRGAWKAQELVKGVGWTSSLADLFMARGQAGWERDLWYLGVPPAAIGNQELRTRPYFDEFIERDLIHPDPARASNRAAEKKVQYDLLARGLPALSFAAAANPLGAEAERNFDMEASGRAPGQWPHEGHEGGNAGRWLHSDFKNVALPYVFEIYAAMIAKGDLR